mmetsp:Transcript_39198/g.124785  ORF Transcript_39198/g.124785 Transcript_39198/m.124785 type:complete len:329 (-) Transcript_39198:830-1816(-)
MRGGRASRAGSLRRPGLRGHSSRRAHPAGRGGRAGRLPCGEQSPLGCLAGSEVREGDELCVQEPRRLHHCDRLAGEHAPLNSHAGRALGPRDAWQQHHVGKRQAPARLGGLEGLAEGSGLSLAEVEGAVGDHDISDARGDVGMVGIYGCAQDIAPSVDPAHCGSALRSLDHLGGAVHPNGAPRRSHDSCGDAQVGAPPAAQVQHGLTEAEGRSSQCEKRTASGAGRLPHRSWEAVGKRGGVAEREGPAQATRCHAAAGAGCVPSRGTLLPPARFGEGRKTVEHRLGEPPPAGHGPGRAPSGEMEAMKMGAEALSQQMTWFYLLDADSR